MEKIIFKYPRKIQFSKLVYKIVIVLVVFVLIPLILKNNKPTDFGSMIEYFLAMSSPLLIVLASIIYLGSWYDLEVATDGIYVEFLWKKIYVPWNSIIIAIKSMGKSFVRVDVVLVDQSHLTLFHRIYSLFTVGSFHPGFHIHPHFLESRELFKLIQKHRSGNRI